MFKGGRLGEYLGRRAGDRILITIRVPGEAPERIELWIRFGPKPRVKLV